METRNGLQGTMTDFVGRVRLVGSGRGNARHVGSGAGRTDGPALAAALRGPGRENEKQVLLSAHFVGLKLHDLGAEA